MASSNEVAKMESTLAERDGLAEKTDNLYSIPFPINLENVCFQPNFFGDF